MTHLRCARHPPGLPGRRSRPHPGTRETEFDGYAPHGLRGGFEMEYRVHLGNGGLIIANNGVKGNIVLLPWAA